MDDKNLSDTCRVCSARAARYCIKAQTGERQSNYSLLYWVHNSQEADLIGSYYAGAAYHPDVGLYRLDYDYGTDLPLRRAQTDPVSCCWTAATSRKRKASPSIWGLQVPNGDYTLWDLEGGLSYR